MLDTTTTPLSLAHFHHPCVIDGIGIRTTLFGRPANWSLGQCTHKDPEVREEFLERLGRVLRALQVGRALAPSPVKFTDRLIEASELTTVYRAGSFPILRNPDKPADAVPLEAGDAFIISPSSCAITVMARQGKMVAMHTGRDCLIDKYALLNGVHAPGRKHHSVCFSALEYLGRPDEVKVKVFWAVPPHLFKHSLDHHAYAQVNRAMHEAIVRLWGPDSVPMRDRIFRFDIPKLIRDQCMAWGVPEKHIDLTHAYHGLNGTWLDGTPGTPRNLVVMARR